MGNKIKIDKREAQLLAEIGSLRDELSRERAKRREAESRLQESEQGVDYLMSERDNYAMKATNLSFDLVKLEKHPLLTYQRDAMRTSAIPADDPTAWRQAFDNCVLGLCGESGEIADSWKKHRHQGHGLDPDEMIGELGDVLWYVALGAEALGTTVADVAERNINKLKARYPDGFSEERSRERGESDS